MANFSSGAQHVLLSQVFIESLQSAIYSSKRKATQQPSIKINPEDEDSAPKERTKWLERGIYMQR